jgi:phosphoglycerol transferase
MSLISSKPEIPTGSVTEWLSRLLLPLLGLALWGFYVVRNSALMPTLFSDENTYSALARLLRDEQAQIPIYLYGNLYRITNACGERFYACSNVLNTIFYGLSCLMFYVLARRVCGRGLSQFLALVYMALPMSAFASLFMPEAMYIFVFWLLLAILLDVRQASGVGFYLVVSVILAALMLIKPHALLFLPSAVAFAMLRSWTMPPSTSAPRRWSGPFIVLIIPVTLKLVIGWLLAGTAGLTLFGGFYGGIVERQTEGLARLLEVSWLSTFNGVGHLAAMALLWGFAIFIAVMVAAHTLFEAFLRRATMSQTGAYAVFGLLFLANMIPVTAIFTGIIAGMIPSEDGTRLHLRYYAFALPLLLLVVASAELALFHVLDRKRYFVAAAIALVVIAASTFAVQALYNPVTADTPELAALTQSHWHLAALAILAIAPFIAAAVSPAWGKHTAVLFSIPLITALAAFGSNAVVAKRLEVTQTDTAGLFAHAYLSPDERKRILVVGDRPTRALRALFHIDTPEASQMVLEKEKPLDVAQAAQTWQWVLLLGERQLSAPADVVVRMEGFSLLHIAQVIRLNMMDQTAWPAFIESVTGINRSTGRGITLQSAGMALKFRKPLPPAFIVKVMLDNARKQAGVSLLLDAGGAVTELPVSDGEKTLETRVNNSDLSANLTVRLKFTETPAPGHIHIQAIEVAPALN